MDENLHNIDDLFKKALDEHEETPSDIVWENIDKNLDKKKVVFILEKYNKLKWVAAALLILSTGMAMYTWHTKIKDKELTKRDTAIGRRKMKENGGQKGENKETYSNNTAIPNLKEDAVITDSISIPAINNKIDTSVTDRKNIGFEENPNGRTFKELQREASQKVAGDLADNRVDLKERKEAQNEIPADTEGITTGGKVEEKQTTQNSDSVSTGKKLKNALNVNFDIAEKNQIKIIDLSTELQNNFLVDSSNNTLQKVLSAQGGSPGIALQNRYDFKSKTNHSKKALFSATAFYSRDFVSSKVDDDHHRFREEDRNEIKSKEEIKSSYTTGLLIDYSTGKKFGIESGLTFSSMITAIAPKQLYAREDDRGNVNFRFNCSAGYSYIPAKSGSNIAVGDSIPAFSSKNILQYIGIPVALKYNITNGRFNLNPGIGITLNLLTKGKIETAIPGISGPEKTSLDHIEGLTKTYLNGLLSLSVNYDLSQNIALSFTPAAKLPLTSINKDAPVKTYLNSLALAAGLLIRL